MKRIDRPVWIELEFYDNEGELRHAACGWNGAFIKEEFSRIHLGATNLKFQLNIESPLNNTQYGHLVEDILDEIHKRT